MKNSITPIYILSGFLGSGKTSLLTRLIPYWQQQGLKPAVVMNEIGEVNIDSVAAGHAVPTAEMLSGCICCSIRADLAGELGLLIRNEKPDVIILEATGAANPMEILDGLAEAALYMNIEVKQMITVVDSAHLLYLHRQQRAKTYRLMQEQIRCANKLILNKTDRLNNNEQQEAGDIVAKWNPLATMVPAVRCEVDLDVLLTGAHAIQGNTCSGKSEAEHSSCGSSNDHDHGGTHHTHHHVMSYTHHLQGPVDSVHFEHLIRDLPRDIYRAKGIVSFRDTASRFLFQYAFRETDYTKLAPQAGLQDVLVFIGEQFDRDDLQARLEKLAVPD
ncbi:CobW family GTP-binding protein [Paenibacillus lemnae]|uniref:GTP-binding protein n=1 Tax=Paenibacillus lemnae TaxID=1330551 RepID=A0A848M9T2_PAELE|nr:CobW family GTP-binding protein [Paenibacillus lemnae]NMO96254.1 GTP-binding protein [Paenibacillus lemnae]